jgi:hypothetical protein
MRKQRLLVQGAWYEVRTAINNREPLFRRRQAIAIFCRIFGEARGRFAFELRGFRLEKEWLSFYIKPADGLQLPAIMQWGKQTFAVRFNRCAEKVLKKSLCFPRYYLRFICQSVKNIFKNMAVPFSIASQKVERFN